MKPTTRRRFLAASAVSAAALTVAPRNVLGANDKVRFALIGCGGRGGYVARSLIEQGAELAYLCDLHNGRIKATAEFLAQVQDKPPKIHKHMKYVFDAGDIDACVIATPDHWHAPAAILACQAGKDVYVEKPHAYCIWESRKMLEAARRHNIVLQVGTQNRSAPYNLAALDYVKSGKLGNIHLVKVYNLKPGGPFHLGDPGSPPPDFDWNEWLGPAPYRDFHQRIFDHGWHQFWDFSGGDLADCAAHQIDLAMMMMGNPGLPRAVSCSGGRLEHAGDDSEVPDLQVVAYDFPGFVMTLEHSNYPRYMRKTTGTIRRNDKFPYWTQNATRIELYGSELLMTIGRHGGGWQVMGSGGRVVDQMYGRPADDDHTRNFIACVKSRKRPNADIDIAHPSVCLLHFANIAYRIGNKKLWFDPDTYTFTNCDDATHLIKRDYREGYEPKDT